MIQEITADEVNKSLLANEKVVMLDVRTMGEFGRNHIKGAINIPVDELDEKVTKSLADKSSKIYVYCLSGSRSEVATELMSQMGFKNVFNMTGGLLVWRIKQFPLETK